jgi:hypothetical protein
MVVAIPYRIMITMALREGVMGCNTLSNNDYWYCAIPYRIMITMVLREGVVDCNTLSNNDYYGIAV